MTITGGRVLGARRRARRLMTGIWSGDPGEVRVALIGLMLIGLALRIWFMLVWRPALTGYSDSGIYFQDVVDSVWTDPLRTVGYSMFLRLLHGISPHLILVPVVQHLLGLWTALLLFGAARRAGAPSGLCLLPAAMIALGGDQLFMEHAALSDSLFIFLVVAMLYCAVRARTVVWWALGAGLCAGFAVWDREAGLLLGPIVAVWLCFSAGRPTRRLLLAGVLTLVAAAATVGGYVAWREAATNLTGITTNGDWNLYGRVASWADCTKFTPPRGTQQLCDPTPPSQRGYTSASSWIFDYSSPAQKLIGPPYEVSADPYAMARLREFSESAIWGQPLDYAHAVLLDLWRLISPNAPSYGDLSADALINYLLDGPGASSGQASFVGSWEILAYPHDAPADHGDIGPLKEWERLTRITGVPMVLLLLLLLGSPWLVPRGARAGAWLFGSVSLFLLLFPILTTGYDYRYTIPAFGPMVAVGALSAWGVVARIRARASDADVGDVAGAVDLGDHEGV